MDQMALLAFWYKWYLAIHNSQPMNAGTLDLWFISLAYHLISRRADPIDVFISYSHKDQAFVRPLSEELKKLGQIVWVDSDIPPAAPEWKQEVYDAIDQACNFVFVISPDSVVSRYCRDEIAYAAKRKKKLIPLKYREVASEKVKEANEALSKPNWIKFSESNDFGETLQKLIEAIKTDLNYKREHTRLLTLAIDWDREGRDESSLLQGNKLAAARQWLSQAAEKEPQPSLLHLQYIPASSEAEAKRQRAEINRQREQKFIVVFLLIGVIGLGVVALIQYRKAELGKILALGDSSKTRYELNQEFEALREGLEAGGLLDGELLKKVEKFDALRDSLKPSRLLEGKLLEEPSRTGTYNATKRVVTALQQAVYGVREQNRLEGHDNWVYDVSLSPDGKTIATVSADKNIKLWNLHGKEITPPVWREKFEHENWIYSVSFSPDLNPDHQIIATADADGKVKLWNRRDGTYRTTLADPNEVNDVSHTDRVVSVSFSPNGRTIATASWDGKVKLWNRDSKEKPWSWDGKEPITLDEPNDGVNDVSHDDRVNSVSFSPNSKMIATASDDSTIKLWRTQDGTWRDSNWVKTLSNHTDKVYSVSFSPDCLDCNPDHQIIATASWDKTVKLWTTQDGTWRDGKEFKTLNEPLGGHTDRVFDISFSPDGQTIATASADKTVKLWNRDGTLRETLNGHTDRVLGVSFSKDNETIASASADKTIRLWKRKSDFFTAFQGHSDAVRSVSVSPDPDPARQIIATASDDNTVKLWNQNGTLRSTLLGHKKGVWGVSFSPDGQTIATASADKTVKLWNRDGILHRTLLGHEKEVFSVSFSPDSKTIATASADETVRLWNRDNKDKLWNWDGKNPKILKDHEDRVVDVSFSPDNQTIATASDDSTVKLWKRKGSQFIPFQTLYGHKDEVNSVSFSPNSPMIATASDDSTVKLWKREGSQFIRFKTLSGHGDRVLSVDFSRDGNMLASASFDKTVRIWNKDGVLLQTLSGHDDWVWDVSFSRDDKSKILASVSQDNTVKLWRFDKVMQQQQPLQLDILLKWSCDYWLRDYLENNPKAKVHSQLCKDIKQTSANQPKSSSRQTWVFRG